VRYVGQMWRRAGSVVSIGAVVAVLALAVPGGGADARGAAGTDSRATSRMFTPTHGTSVGARFFGLHAPLLGTLFPQAPAGSVDLTTNNVYWPQLETSPGVFDYSTLDPMVAQAAAHHAKPLLVLGVTPSFAAAQTAGLTQAQIQASVPDMVQWQSYVRAVVTRYQDALEYQIWPEPDVKNNFSGTPQQMADLVAAAAKIIHSVAPGATVVAPAMVLRLHSERAFMKAFFGSTVGGKPIGSYVDAVGVDPYPLLDGTPEDSIALVQHAQKVLAAEHVTAPLWNLEVNYFVPVGGVTTAAPPTDRISMSYVIRTYVLNAATNVKRVYWLGWLRYFNLGISMVGDDGVTPTASGQAFSRVHDWLLGQHARGCAYDKVSGVYSCEFVRAGRSSWVYWTQLGSSHVKAPAGARHVQSMYGVTTSTGHGDRIRVTNAPVWVSHQRVS
jgi:polysaccharide biosynthesis protein PslG